MAKITIDGREIECRDGIPVLQAALEAGWDVPHYCYHPGLPIVASCRLCLMDMKMPLPKTGEIDWSPKLIPSCQTPVKNGLEVRFASEKVRDNQRHCMEYYLLNHPLDCPVCDKAGECWLQDYSYKFGNPASRMVDQKLKNPKKDIGPRTLLYQDRCVMCSRCVRFCDEIAGTHELGIVNRGARAEIDVFPGIPLDNALQGNVVDICPVGSLLDKDFLFDQRVWFMSSTPSICPRCATGCAIHVDHNEGVIYRLRPRFNPGVNDWWMCDEGRFGWKYTHDQRRIAAPLVRRGLFADTPQWRDLPDILRVRLAGKAQQPGSGKVALVLSPFVACEEAWLLVKFIRDLTADATLCTGPVPVVGDDQRFPAGAAPNRVKFTILKEKCPNRRGVEMILKHAGGNVIAFEDFVARGKQGEFAAVWIAGGYPDAWVTKDLLAAAGKAELLVVQEMFPSELTEAATIVLPACASAEREGSFVNAQGKIQPFERAIEPPEGAHFDGQYLFELAGFSGLYTGERVRELMAATMPEFAAVHVPPLPPAHAH
ncbi:MAG TPA: 2Fe-2S iron-sulfur cluster-binding protein [Phycisphaerae bacterium]|jgi:NADH-quinone oxidoreductase subunit G